MGDWFGGGLVRVEMARDLSSSAQIASAGVGAGAVVSAVGLESLNAWVQVEPSPADCLPHQDDCLPHHADCLPHQRATSRGRAPVATAALCMQALTTAPLASPQVRSRLPLLMGPLRRRRRRAGPDCNLDPRRCARARAHGSACCTCPRRRGRRFDLLREVRSPEITPVP